MYIGAWQDYHLGKKSINHNIGKNETPKSNELITLDDMKRALLLSLDAETTRKAIAALDFTYKESLNDKKTLQKEFAKSLRRKRPFVKNPSKLPPLLVLDNSNSIVSYSSSNYNQKDDFSSEYKNSKYNGSLRPIVLERSTVSEPSQITQPVQPSSSTRAKAFQRGNIINSSYSNSLDEESTISSYNNSISQSYDSGAVVDILRTNRSNNKYKQFFGASANNGPKVSENCLKVSLHDEKLSSLKKMQELYVRPADSLSSKDNMNNDANTSKITSPLNNNFHSYKKNTYQAPKTPSVNDIDLTDHELSLISKYFKPNSSDYNNFSFDSISNVKSNPDKMTNNNINFKENPTRIIPIPTPQKNDSYEESGIDYMDENLLEWCDQLKLSTLDNF